MFITTAFAEEEAQQAASWLGLTQNGWIIAIAVVLVVLVGLMSIGTRKVWNARSLSYAALCLALAYVLRYIKLFAAAYGVGPGMLVGAAYGFLRYLSGGWFVHPVQFLLDYPLAFALIGLTGLYLHLPKNSRKWGLYLCMILGAIGRAASATLAGVFFWDTAFIPSLVYNGTYLIPDTLICLVIAIPLAERLLKLMRSR